MSGNLFVKPSIVPVDSSGQPLANATYTFYLSGTTTLTAIYADADLTASLSNPTVADAGGVFAPIWLDRTITYRAVLQTSGGALVEDVDPYPADNHNALTAAEIAAGITSIDATYLPGDPRRHLAALDGATDDTAELINWAKVGGDLNFPAGFTAMISAEIPLYSNTKVTFGSGGTILSATPDIAFFHATSKSNVSVRYGTFQQTVVGTAAYVGGVMFERCTSCVSEYNNFIGMQWAGTYIRASSFCSVKGNYISAFLGAVSESGDIIVTSDSVQGSHWNVIDGNFCFGGSHIGIVVEDPYSGIVSTRNIVTNNRIGGTHTGYGIIIYMPTASNSYNTISHNYIEGVTGSVNTSKGAGIYVVGAGSGGAQISDNTIFNCCVSTDNETLAPAGIGIAGTSAGTVPLVITGNIIDGMSKYHGILLTGVRGGANVTGNSIRQPLGNTTGHALKITNSTNVSVTGNTITQLDTASTCRGILIAAISANCSNITVSGNTVTGGNLSQIETSHTGGGAIITFTGTPSAADVSATLSTPWALPTGVYSVGIVETVAGRVALRRVTLTFGNTTATWTGGLGNNSNAAALVYLISGLKLIGNDLNGGTSTCLPLTLTNQSASNVLVSGNTINASSLSAISQTGCPGVRYVSNDITSAGAVVFLTSGVCTGSFFDKSNLGHLAGFNAGTGSYPINNAGTGVYVESQGGAVPATGTWAVGNRVEHHAPAAGNPLGWNCTVAGTPGTWVAWANL